MHIEVLQLCFRLQDRFYTHHWVFCHFFIENKPFYGSKNVCLYVCTEKLLFYSFSLLDVIYNEILQVWYFKVSTTACFLYLQTLRKQKKNKQKKRTTKNKMIWNHFFFCYPKRFSVTLYFAHCLLLYELSSSSCIVDVYFITFYE